MLPLPTFSTPATDALCKQIAKKSKGVCFLGFSRGKDSVCAWLQLRRFFDRIIPFHCATLPGLEFAEKALRYYEDEFERHILRMMDASLSSDLIQYLHLYKLLHLVYSSHMYEYFLLEHVLPLVLNRYHMNDFYLHLYKL